uniref:Vacuolar protein sorting-associated protein 18 homolog n=1 Tax=Callorhinchus milii TaxID=7868 RepID=A0A4W3J9J1_CALMI
CLSLGKDTLLRIDLGKPEQPNQIELSRKDDARIHKLFLDSTGSHLLISLTTSECLYLNRNTQKVRSLSRWRGHLIESVGWNKVAGTEASTGPILVGTSQGHVFQAELLASEERLFTSSPDQYFRVVYSLEEEGLPTPVCSLEIEKGIDGRFFIIVTTRKRLYQFVGRPLEPTEQMVFQPIFSQYADAPPSFQEFPVSLGYSDVSFYTPRLRSSPRCFAWMMGNGVLYGTLDYTRPDSLLSEVQVWEYPPELELHTQPPSAIVLTQFHFVLLLPDRLKAVCTLNGQPVHEDIFPDKQGRLVGLVKDPVSGLIWVYTDRAVFRYHIQREARHVWQMYMDMDRFDLAKEYCRDRPECLDVVLGREADYSFHKQRYLESARAYALTHRHFEEIALKFIEVEQEAALREFLLRKLGTLKAEDRTQRILLITWLVEIYLNKLGELEGRGAGELQATREEFRAFLSNPRNRECLQESRATLYQLLASHGAREDALFFAVIMQDYERVVAHHCQHEDYSAALEVLSRYRHPGLFYKFSPLLMQHLPRQVVDAWIQMRKQLDPKSLIPALVNYSQLGGWEQECQAVRYLEFCVCELEVTDQAIHNYLLSLYAKYQPSALLSYLQQAGPAPSPGSTPGSAPAGLHYDVKYALRLCAESGHHRACVHIYSIMGLYEEAVGLALQVDVDLAKACADLPEEDEELRKKLWLTIARHVVQEEEDVKKAMVCVSSCHLLKIEDILPFFPNFVTIDHFKEAICTSLEEYNQHITELKQEMEEATESARRIREDIQEMRNKYGVVESQEKCAACDFPLLNRSFYLFLCGHMFHADCLLHEVLSHLSSTKKTRLEELQRLLVAMAQPKARLRSRPEEGAPETGSEPPSRETIKSKIDEEIARECVYCGELMVRSIDKPFIDPLRDEEERRSWL